LDSVSKLYQLRDRNPIGEDAAEDFDRSPVLLRKKMFDFVSHPSRFGTIGGCSLSWDHF